MSSLAIHALYLLLNGGACVLLQLEAAARKAVVLMASQKTLPVAMTVLAFLPDSAVSPEQKGLLAIPCIVFHLGQIFMDAVIATRWGNRSAGRYSHRADYGSCLTERTTMRCLVVAALIAVSLLACGDSDSVVGDNNGDQRTEEGDRAQLAEMRREINALVGDAAGTSIEDCRYAGVGSKPCGGPWEFIVYSASSTDSTALAEKLTAYNALKPR